MSIKSIEVCRQIDLHAGVLFVFLFLMYLWHRLTWFRSDELLSSMPEDWLLFPSNDDEVEELLSSSSSSCSSPSSSSSSSASSEGTVTVGLRSTEPLLVYSGIVPRLFKQLENELNQELMVKFHSKQSMLRFILYQALFPFIMCSHFFLFLFVFAVCSIHSAHRILSRVRRDAYNLLHLRRRIEVSQEQQTEMARQLENLLAQREV
jgi:hypothetical protein